MAAAQDFDNRGAEDFPELKFRKIKGAPKLQKPFLVMGETGPVKSEKHGLAAPALWDWDGDDKRDLLIGEFETTRGNNLGENGSTVRVYKNIGEDNDPKFSDDWEYAKDTKGRPLEVDQWCCIGFTPQFVDLNDDGLMDIISGQYHPGDVTWFRGTRRGFAPGRKLEQEGDPWSAINNFTLQNNDVNPNDVNPIETFGYWAYSSANFGDLDGDGDHDMINGGHDITVAENTGDKENPGFGRRVPLMQTDGKPLTVKVPTREEIERANAYGGSTLSGAGKTQQHVVDWDNDGVLDILSTDEYRDGAHAAVTFFKGVKVPDGMQQFEPGIPLFEAEDGSKAFPGSGQRVYVDDWNKDGVKDLIVGASVVTVDNKFHGAMSWQYEGELDIPSAGKDIGRSPGQLDVLTLSEFKERRKDHFRDWSEEEWKRQYETLTGYIKQKIEKLKKVGLDVEDAKKMRHQGYVYVFLGGK